MRTEMLVINASPHGRASRSFRMFSGLMADAAGTSLTVEHLAEAGPAEVSADFATAVLRPSSEGSTVLERSEAHLRHLERADAVAILTPIHNLSVPAALKCWIDHVVRRDRSFRPSPTGKIGLLRDRPTLVLVTSGGFHLGPQANQKDFLTPYLTEILASIGIQAVEFIHLQGTVVDQAAVAAAEGDAEASLRNWIMKHEAG